MRVIVCRRGRRRTRTPRVVHCSHCGRQHVDAGKWATFDHDVHLCGWCGRRFETEPCVGVVEEASP